MHREILLADSHMRSAAGITAPMEKRPSEQDARITPDKIAHTLAASGALPETDADMHAAYDSRKQQAGHEPGDMNSARSAAQRAARSAAAAAIETEAAPRQQQTSEQADAVRPQAHAQLHPDFVPGTETHGRPNFGRMMHEKRESILQLREKGQPVDRRAKFEDGQPARGSGMYDVKEERERPRNRAFKPRQPRAGRLAVAGSHKGRADGGANVPPKARDEL